MMKTQAVKDDRSAARSAGRKERAARLNDMEISVAKNHDEVAAAWNLVYESYRQANLINDNPYGIHTVMQAFRNGTAVVIGRVKGEIVCTLTIMPDDPQHGGIPLDSVYKSRLNELRQNGHRLIEAGLFAHRQLSISRSITAFSEMMRYVFYNSCYNMADIVIGVHPSHAAFYKRNYGFIIDGPVGVHPIVNNNPVVLLRGDPLAQLRTEPLLPQVVEYVKRPLPRTMFANRAPLRQDTIVGTVLESFVEWGESLWGNVTGMPCYAEAKIA